MTILLGVLFGAGAVLFLAEVVLSAWAGRPLHRWKDTLAAFAFQAMTGVVSFAGKACPRLRNSAGVRP